MRNLHVSDTLGYSRNWNRSGIPKDRDEVITPEVQWSKQSFYPHHPGGVSDTPPWIFLYKFIGKMLNFSVKKRDYSLTS
jgi:hypothetical protein